MEVVDVVLQGWEAVVLNPTTVATLEINDELFHRLLQVSVLSEGEGQLPPLSSQRSNEGPVSSLRLEVGHSHGRLSLQTLTDVAHHRLSQPLREHDRRLPNTVDECGLGDTNQLEADEVVVVNQSSEDARAHIGTRRERVVDDDGPHTALVE